MRPWLTDALSGVRSRSTGLKELLSESARELAARTQQLEEAVTHSVVNYLQLAPTARELEARLEADARRLSRPGPAAEVLQRWVSLIGSGGGEERYPDGASAAPAPAAAPSSSSGAASSSSGEAPAAAPAAAPAPATQELSFHQVFLRSRALEFTVDTVARMPDLRAALRERALPPPKAWPEEASAPAAFARAFVELLEATVGPQELWLPILATLLSSERGPADEMCHAWLVQMLVGARSGWAEAAVIDREVEVKAAEEAAAQCIERLGPAPAETSAPGSLAVLIACLQQHGRAAEAGHRAWRLRGELAGDLAEAAAKREDAAQERASFTASIALVARERARELEESAAKQRSASEESRGNLRTQESDVRAQLGSVQPVLQQIDREIEEAEMTQHELLQTAERLSKQIEGLRQRRAEQVRLEDTLRTELQRVESTFAATIVAEDEAHNRTEGARALAATVAELASGRVDPQAEGGSPCKARLEATAERSSEMAASGAFSLAEAEVGRLQLLLRTVTMCTEVAEERQRSRKAMVELGVPTTTLESDVVGEAEISQSLSGALAEADRCHADVEELCRHLLKAQPAASGPPATPASGSGEAPESGEAAPAAAPEAAAGRAAELAETLRACLAACDERRAKLAALAPEASEAAARAAEGPAGAGGTGGACAGAAELPLPKGDPFLLFM